MNTRRQFPSESTSIPRTFAACGIATVFFAIGVCSSVGFAKMALPKSPLLQPANFQLCFEVSHARCFTVDDSKPGFLRQVSALQDSAAKITAADTHRFKNDIKIFMKSIAFASTEKTELCQQGLSFRLLDSSVRANSKEPITELRCLEKISTKELSRLTAIVESLQRASKPQRARPAKTK